MSSRVCALLSLLFVLSSACGESKSAQDVCEATCNGCCDTDGTCRPGDDTFRCGANGNACTQCIGASLCAFGLCANPSIGGTGGGFGSSGGGVGSTGGGFGSTGGGFAPTGGGFGSTGGGSGSTGGGSASTGGGASSGGSAPVITSMPNSRGDGFLSPSGYATISVSAADADGLGDLSGGTLSLTSTGQVLTGFSGSAGFYSANLSWTMLQTQMDISFVQSMTIEVTATIYDQASHVATRNLTVTLACNAGLDGLACSGTCSSIYSTSTCGSCGNDCNARLSGAWNIRCNADGACLGDFRDETTTPRTCNSVCAGHSATCMAITNDSVGNGIYNDQCAEYLSTCTQLPSTSSSCGSLNAVNCHCG